MKLKLTVELEDRTARCVSDNAIERVINSSINICESSRHPDAYVNRIDWEENKKIVTTLWVRLQDAIFRHFNNLEPQE